ncbi:hypothetical protein C7999DRAFT_44940 [Corynascus novoguineensis]|uniref:ABM domain-containing protein n=1 Tax=Corynascus novoguineensis TaxID=1126955 RepID=A0AAN7CLX0_9PEZI|nr:hypothetical protein C7999DRAFT_44940 [Corynascus novoguineensis]
MARTKMTVKRYRHVTTWTRFHLPLKQEWPTWTIGYSDMHVGPLEHVKGAVKLLLGRMVDDPEQAAYIIEWRDLDDLKNFQSSPACAEFLRNLPERDNLQVSVKSTSSASRSLTIEDALSSSLPLEPSRFLTLEEITEIPAAEVEDRVTLNAFLVPRKGNYSTMETWYESLRAVFGSFQPCGSEFIRGHGLWWERYMTTWFWTLAEDGWVGSKFGNMEPIQEDIQGQTIIYEFHLWPHQYGATPEHEEASATDPQARESWNEAVAKERWDIRKLPCYESPEKIDPEDMEEKLLE